MDARGKFGEHERSVRNSSFLSISISRIWDANLTIFCSFDKKVNFASFDFRSCVFNIQVHVPGGGGGTPLYGLYRYVPRNRVWFLEVLDP